MHAAVGNLVPETDKAEWQETVRSTLIDGGLRATWTEREQDGYLVLTFAPSVDAVAVIDAVTTRLQHRSSERFRPTVSLSPDLWRFLARSTDDDLSDGAGVRNTFTGQGTVVQAGVIIGDVVLPPTVEHLTALLDQVDQRRTAAARNDEHQWAAKELDRSVIPTQPTECFGRRRELAALRKALRHRHHVVVFGPSGIGKSTLLAHAAAVGVLSADALPDCVGVVWPTDPVVSGAGLLRTLLSQCYQVDPDTPVSQPTARRLLRPMKALVVLDDIELPADELRPVIKAMPRSVFVIASQRTDLWRLAVPVPVGGLPEHAARALVEARLGERLTDEDAARVEEYRQDTNGNPDELCHLASHMREASTLGTIGRIPAPDERTLIVPRLVGWLPAPARASLDAMAVIPKAAWGPDLVAAVTDAADDRGPAKLLHAPLARHVGTRYRLLTQVLDHLPTDHLRDPLSVADRVAAWIVRTAGPRAVAAEIDVLDRLLDRMIDAGEFWSALIVARCAANRLTIHGHGAAWGIVLRHGFTAAVRARSRPDAVYFGYALAVQRMEQGAGHEAVRYLTSIDAGDRRVAARVEALRTAVRQDADEQVLTPQVVAARLVDAVRIGVRTQWSAGLPLLRPVTRGLQSLLDRLKQAPVVRTVVTFAERSPNEFRAVVSAMVAIVAVAALTAASAPRLKVPPVITESAPPTARPPWTPVSPTTGRPPAATAGSPPAAPVETSPATMVGGTSQPGLPVKLVPPVTTPVHPTVSTSPTVPSNTCQGTGQVTRPTPGSLNAISGSAEDDVWAAGYAGSANTAHTFVQHWDGCRWSEADMPALADVSWLSGLTALSRNMAWAVGSTQTSTNTRTLTERWDGTAWTAIPSPSPGGDTDELISVWAPNTTEAWAVGSTETVARQHSALILHWDGVRWSQVATPPPPGDERVSLNGVSGTGPDDVWAVGTYELAGVYHSLVEHWDGHVWQLSQAPTGQLTQVAARSANDVWAAGVTDDAQPLILHWNGTVWTNEALAIAGTNAEPFAVVPVGDDDVWAFGGQGQVTMPSSYRTLVEHWDGTSWHVVATPDDTVLDCVLLDAELIGNTIWTVGGAGQQYDQYIIERLPQ